MAYLFGDLPSVNYQDVISIFAGVVIVLMVATFAMSPAFHTNRDMAFADGGTSTRTLKAVDDQINI